MSCELQKLKEKLDRLLMEKSLTSGDVLELSREIDLLIAEYYRQNDNQLSSSCSIVREYA